MILRLFEILYFSNNGEIFIYKIFSNTVSWKIYCWEELIFANLTLLQSSSFCLLISLSFQRLQRLLILEENL